MGVHLMIFGACNVVGTAAVPKGSTNAVGNHGTVTTCTVQGFLIYVSLMTAFSYYCSFSVYSYVGTLKNFDKSAFQNGMETYIHVLVHLYPLATALYITSQQLFNNTGFGYCFVEGDPIGCGGSPRATNEAIVPCDRGGQTYQTIQLVELLWDIPLFIMLLFPTAVMITLYLKVKKRQDSILILSCEVAQQSLYYLLVIYAGVIPSAVVHTLDWFQFLTTELATNLTLFSNVMATLCGLWTVIMYLYFSNPKTESVQKYRGGEEDGDGRENNNDSADELDPSLSDGVRMNSGESGANIFSFCPETETEHNSTNDNNQSNHLSLVAAGTKTTNTDPTNASTRRRNSSTKSRNRSGSDRVSRKFSFNIFDGTNASSAYSDFIFDGDSEDEREDHRETQQWSSVQDQI
ncbi:unnamed protein product [Pseudo-nitzschia multistriata]|uniref:G-protein coupled receptors family 2 profile 2 domain-containing protein n=1 Tax=Pseudo-nitzschia multistriata TaxID=183589 RepID=A0A448ZQT0_9STRA|nr:unnamed protein product [Pseudo-nitzschia multistriata]